MKKWLWLLLMSTSCYADPINGMQKDLCIMEKDAMAMVFEYEGNFDQPCIYYYYVGRLLCIYDVKSLIQTRIDIEEK